MKNLLPYLQNHIQDCEFQPKGMVRSVKFELNRTAQRRAYWAQLDAKKQVSCISKPNREENTNRTPVRSWKHVQKKPKQWCFTPHYKDVGLHPYYYYCVEEKPFVAPQMELRKKRQSKK